MTSLFDVSMRIRRFDRDHVHYGRARDFWAEAKNLEWATCPLTEHGFVSIISLTNYRDRIPSA